MLTFTRHPEADALQHIAEREASGMTANPNVHPDTLPCGCRRGHYLCMKAQELWNEVGRAYERTKQHTLGTDAEETAWAEYEQAREQYDLHFEEAE